MEPEALWKQLLSEKSAQILRAWRSLSAEEQSAVRVHLNEMVREAGWHPGQRRAAEAALRCIEEPEK
jgi:hypothetical protein